MRLNSVGRKEVSFFAPDIQKKLAVARWLCRNGFKETNNVFSFRRIVAQSVRHQYIIKSARSTWNFVRQQATLAQGSASEAHLNMDVNMRRLPELIRILIEIPSALCRLYACIGADRLCHYSVKMQRKAFSIS